MLPPQKTRKIGKMMVLRNNLMTIARCRDGYVKVYINGQEEQHKYDQHDYMFCGEKSFYFGSLSLFFQQSLFFVVPGQASPQTINSPGPRLVLLFKAGMKSASGFKAQYRFETGECPECPECHTN